MNGNSARPRFQAIISSSVMVRRFSGTDTVRQQRPGFRPQAQSLVVSANVVAVVVVVTVVVQMLSTATKFKEK